MRVPSFALILLLLAACAPSPAASPTVTASQTVAAPSPTASPIPSNTPSPAATESPAADLSILAPGSGSSVTSPIRLELQVPNASSALLWIELKSQSGEQLYRRVLDTADNPLVLEILFEVRAPGAAFLTASLADRQGRLLQARSVELHLLSEGPAQLLPAQTEAAIALASPVEGAEISGGRLAVEGTLGGGSARPLTAQLVAPDGRILAVTEIYPAAPDYRSFAGELSYQLNEASEARVVVFRSGGEQPGLWFLESREVSLLP